MVGLFLILKFISSYVALWSGNTIYYSLNIYIWIFIYSNDWLFGIMLFALFHCVKVPFFNSFNVFPLKLNLIRSWPPWLSFIWEDAERGYHNCTIDLKNSSYCGTASCVYPCSITIVSGKTSTYFVGLNSLLFLLKT